MNKPVHLALPDSALLASNKAVAKAAADWSKLVERHRAELVRLGQAESAVPASEAADRAAYAAALRHGKADPGQPAAEKARAAVDAARRLVDGLVVAADAAREDLVAIVEAERSRWRKTLEEDNAEARRDLLAAVDAVDAARRRLADTLGVTSWLAAFPSTSHKLPMSAASGVAGLESPNGSPYDFSTVLDALRQFGQPSTRPAPAGIAPDGRMRQPEDGMAHTTPLVGVEG